MKTYYVQFTTDFHLLAALASIENLVDKKVYLIGPSTGLVSVLCEKFSFRHYDVNPCSPYLSKKDLIIKFFNAKKNADHVVVSPFIYPVYVMGYLFKKGIRPGRIVRTDEGVGSYASIKHYYNAFRLEQPQFSVLNCLTQAAKKKLAATLTVALGIVDENYLFDKEGRVNQDRVVKIREIIDYVGKKEDLKDYDGVILTQPNLEENFDSPNDYVVLLNKVKRQLKIDNLIIKKHPRDKFDYGSFGFDVLEGFPIEMYDLKKSKVIGFTSTGLLTARLVSGSKASYYLTGLSGNLTFNKISKFNQNLFKKYLDPLDARQFL